MAQIPHNKRRLYSQSECRSQKIQILVNEALAAYRLAIREDRAYVQGKDGRNVTALFRLPRSRIVGTKYELDLSHDVWKVSSRRRHQLRREELIKELIPMISDAQAAERALLGWWPRLKKERPRFMVHERFDAIQVELRDGKPQARRRGHGAYVFKGGRDRYLPP